MEDSRPSCSRPSRSCKARTNLEDVEIAEILGVESEDGFDYDDDSDVDPTFSVDDPTVNNGMRRPFTFPAGTHAISSSDESEATDNELDETPEEANSNLKPSSSNENARKIIWYSEKDNKLAYNPPIFTGCHKVNVHGEIPMDIFLQLISDTLLEEIVYQTNLYAMQKGKENFGLTCAELKVFLGIVLVTSYIKYPRIRQYWSSKDELRLSVIADAMTVNRFEEIRRYLHFIDVTTIPQDNKDLAIKIRPVLAKLHENFHNAVEPEEYQSVDEMMVPFKGRSSLKQYLPKKPKKWGYKIWVRAGVSGYVYCFELFQGAAGNREKPYDCGACGDVVIRLCHDITGKNCKVYADNLFTSIPLVLKLKENLIWYVGTARSDRLKGASQKLKCVKNLKDEGRGSSSVVTSAEDVRVTRWLDTSVVHTVSSYAGIQPEGLATRFSRKDKTFIDIKRPHSIEIYNKHMGGLDLMDSLIALYCNNVRNLRWYMRIFYHLLNVALVNSWIIWKWEGLEKLDLLEFKSSVATALIYNGCSEMQRRKRGRPSVDHVIIKKRVCKNVSNAKRFDNGGHYPKKLDLANASRCNSPFYKRKTRYRCDACNVPLCPECFREFHTK